MMKNRPSNAYNNKIPNVNLLVLESNFSKANGHLFLNRMDIHKPFAILDLAGR